MNALFQPFGEYFPGRFPALRCHRCFIPWFPAVASTLKKFPIERYAYGNAFTYCGLSFRCAPVIVKNRKRARVSELKQGPGQTNLNRFVSNNNCLQAAGTIGFGTYLKIANLKECSREEILPVVAAMFTTVLPTYRRPPPAVGGN